MAKHKPVEIDPKEIKRAEELWAGFIVWSKYSTIGTCATLVILAAVFIDF